MSKELSDEEHEDLSVEEREEKLSQLVEKFESQSEYKLKRYQQVMDIAQTRQASPRKNSIERAQA
jgi:hypothetical protein